VGFGSCKVKPLQAEARATKSHKQKKRARGSQEPRAR
jgi:hypothetical protein